MQTLSPIMPQALLPQTTTLSGFDISTPMGRAHFLVALKEKRTSFSKEDGEAYNALRDEMMLFARNVGSLEALQQQAERFSVFLVSQETKTVKKVVDAEMPAEAPVVVEKSVPFIPVPTPVATKPRIMHRGPDIVMLEKSSVDTVPALEAMPVDAPKEIVAPAPTPTPTPTPATEAVAPVPEKKQGTTREELQKRVFDINTGLNEFAHGKAFQWLSNPDTHYREYMNELIALRGRLTSVSLEGQELVGLSASIEKLENLADAVRIAVGGGKKTEEVVLDASVSEVPKKEEMLRVVVMPHEPLPIVKIRVERETPVEKEAEVPHITEERKVAVIPSVIAIEIEKEEPRRIENLATGLSFADSEKVESDTPAPEETIPWGAPSAPPDLPPTTLHTETLHTPHIDTALNNLLTQWLGTTGFLGFGDSGVRHHDWLLMKDIFLEDVLVDTGVIPPGMKPDVYKNMTDNVRAWSTKYGLYNASPTETVENFLRRVVRASIVSAS